MLKIQYNTHLVLYTQDQYLVLFQFYRNVQRYAVISMMIILVLRETYRVAHNGYVR